MDLRGPMVIMETTENTNSPTEEVIQKLTKSRNQNLKQLDETSQIGGEETMASEQKANSEEMTVSEDKENPNQQTEHPSQE